MPDWRQWGVGARRFLIRLASWATRRAGHRRLVEAEALPVAAIDLSGGCTPIACRLAAQHFHRWFSRENSPESWRRPFVRGWRPTTALIDLREWGGHAGWLAAVKKETDGNMGREVRKAQRLGYRSRLIEPDALQGSIAEIRRSKSVRAYGVVRDALSDTTVPDEEGGTDRVPARPSCEKHWDLGWGVFREEEGREVLRGYALTRRVGNLLMFVKFMGHGATLRDGMTKLLMFDVVAWLYAGGDGLAEGVDFVWYGPVEVAAPGLVEWMRDFKFRASLLQLGDPPEVDEDFPPGFSSRRYLRLNPDVAAAGLDARSHWLLFGKQEGRRHR